MTIEKDGNRRSVALEVELAASPEQVWQAIATGPGISSWFVPTQIEERVGGAVVFEVMPGDRSTGSVTAWEPPRRFAYEERDWMPGAPPLATECLVETRAGGIAVVRLVHSLFASTDDWDDQLESMCRGWPSCFRVLQLYLARFAGQPCSIVRSMSDLSGDLDAGWHKLLGGLGLDGAPSAGDAFASKAPHAPPLSGRVQYVSMGDKLRDLLIEVEEPVRGVAAFGVYDWGGAVKAALSAYVYGPEAAETASRSEPAWREWLATLDASR